jgi:hypothetical protein
MTDASFAIILVHGAGAGDHAEALVTKYGRRVVTDPDAVEDGDLLLLDDTTSLTWAASNVLLLSDNRAPIVRAIALADAL